MRGFKSLDSSPWINLRLTYTKSWYLEVLGLLLGVAPQKGHLQDSRTPGRHSGHRQIFREADADESGDLDREELRIALRGAASLAPRKTNYDEFY